MPDNLCGGVSCACRYKQDINPSLRDSAENFGEAIRLGGARRPRENANLAVVIKGLEREIMARLQHQNFFSVRNLIQALRSEIGPEFTSQAILRWAGQHGAERLLSKL